MYTTKERNEIYKKALGVYQEYHCTSLTLGLCYAIRKITGNDSHYFESERRVLFPEFDMFFDDWGFYIGYEKEAFQTRQIILDFCILMTE